MIMQINDELELKIENLGSNGEGVAHLPFTVFVPGALPGETVRGKIILLKKNYAVAKLLQALTPSDERVQPRCPIYDRCGGCQLQHFSYEGQLRVKRQQVVDALTRIGHLACEVQPVLGMDNPWYYRNKMQFPVSHRGGKLAIGCYAVQTHSVINTTSCLIQAEANNIVAQVVRDWMERFHIPAYNEKTQQGLVRHVMARVGKDDQVMAVLITNGEKIPQVEELVAALSQEIPTLKSIIQNINTRATNIIMGNKTKLLWGRESIQQNLGGLDFDISAQSFFQVNTAQAAVLYDRALQGAALTGGETVVDVYCGTGTIALYLAQKAKKVYGIEIVAPAIENAKENAKHNGITNAEFICGDAGVELPKLLQNGVKPDVVVVDPPRAGCEERVVRAIMQVAPWRVVYVSCNPATLARDLAIFNEIYEIQTVQPVDMFPHTTHVETVVVMGKRINYKLQETNSPLC